MAGFAGHDAEKPAPKGRTQQPLVLSVFIRVHLCLRILRSPTEAPSAIQPGLLRNNIDHPRPMEAERCRRALRTKQRPRKIPLPEPPFIQTPDLQAGDPVLPNRSDRVTVLRPGLLG